MMFLFDIIGIGLFIILGFIKIFDFGILLVIVVMMGIVFVVFGGVICDMFCNVELLIFRSEIYVMVCLVGVVFFFIFW